MRSQRRDSSPRALSLALACLVALAALRPTLAQGPMPRQPGPLPRQPGPEPRQPEPIPSSPGSMPSSMPSMGSTTMTTTLSGGSLGGTPSGSLDTLSAGSGGFDPDDGEGIDFSGIESEVFGSDSGRTFQDRTYTSRQPAKTDFGTMFNDSLQESLSQIRRNVGTLLMDGARELRDLLEDNADEIRDNVRLASQAAREGASQARALLEEYGSELRGNVREIAKEIREANRGLDREDIEAVISDTLKTNLDVDEAEIEQLQVEEVIEEADKELEDEVRKTNNGEDVQVTLTLPGEPLSPAIDLVGEDMEVKFHQENFTDFVAFQIATLEEISPEGEVVRSYSTKRLARRFGRVSTLASVVNLGTPTKPARAVEVDLSYPVGNITREDCPAQPEVEAFADTVASAASQDDPPTPTVVMRVYMIGRNAVRINYLGQDILLHPFSLKYTLEIENWPFCSPENKLRLRVKYRYSRKAPQSGVEEIEEFDFPPQQFVGETSDADFEPIVPDSEIQAIQSSIGSELEQLGQTAPDGNELLSDQDLDLVLQELGLSEEGGAAAEGRRRLEAAIHVVNGRRGLQQAGEGGADLDLFAEIEASIEELDEGTQEALGTAVAKLQASVRDLTDDEVAALRQAMRKASKSVYKQTRRVMERKFRELKTEQLSIAASLKLLRRRLKSMQQTFQAGKVAQGWGNSLMFVPRRALVAGKPTDVDVQIEEKDDRTAELTVTFPNCDPKCVWDPTVEFSEEASTVPSSSAAPAVRLALAAAIGLCAMLLLA